MKSSTSSIMKGIGVGMLFGGAAAIIGGSVWGGKKNKYMKVAKKAVKSAEQFMDNLM